jgi:choice-of-anchor A domain-containing protein/LPXTG-motif cell wall-anchored protein
MRTYTPARLAALTAAASLVALSIVAAPAVQLAPVASADAATTICYRAVDDRYPDLTSLAGHSIDPSETETGVYIEGNFTALNGAQETEGNFVVGGDASYYTHTYSNIGVVGIGSLVTPTAGSDVLVTGGDINIGDGTPAPTTVDVSFSSSGNIVAGGTVNGGAGDTLSFNGTGGQTTGVATPLAPYAAVPTYYNLLSTYYAGLADTGTVTTNASTVVFDGDGTAAVQVFTAPDGSVLGAIGAQKKLSFTNIPADAVVIINVTDTTATISTQELVGLNGTDIQWDASNVAADLTFSYFTQSVFWNFPSATSVTFGEGSQIPGSIDAPLADVTLLASTNGRVYAGGNVELGDVAGTQSGLEMHNYAFRGYDCSTPNPGDLRITKSLTDPDGVVTAGRTFTGTYECVDGSSTVVASGTWSLEAGETVTITGIVADAECTVAEDALTAPPSSGDATYSWLTPVYASSDTVTIVADDVVTVDVQNEVQHEVGDLEISKSLTDPDDVVPSGRVYTGMYTCTLASVTVASGSWSVTTSTTQTISDIPAGASCTLTETVGASPSSTDSSYMWQTTVFSPSAATITDGGTATIAVQNSVRRALGNFEMRKVLDDPFGQTSLTRDYTGTFECTHLGDDVTPVPNTWTAKAGDPAQTLATGLPFGTECTLSEDELTDMPVPGRSQFRWDTPTFSAASVTIGDGTTVRITVTNIVYDPFALPHTGEDVATALTIAGGALGLGGLFLALGYRRRVAGNRRTA